MGLLTAAACGTMIGVGLALLFLTALGTRAGAPQPPRTSLRAPARTAAVSTLLRRGLPAAGIGFGLAAVTSWPVLALIGTAGAWFLPGLLLSDGGAGAQIEKVNAVAVFTEALRDTLTAAAGLGQAIAAAAACTPEAIAPEAKQLAALIEDRSLPIDRALRAFGEKLADPTGDLVVIALMYAARDSARDLAPLLSDLAQAARDEAAMHLRIGIARARTRTAVRVITAVTLGLGVLLYVADGPFLAPYGTALGQLALLAISALFATGFAWLARLARPVEYPRLLRPAALTDTNLQDPATSVELLPAPRRPTTTSAHFQTAGR